MFQAFSLLFCFPYFNYGYYMCICTRIATLYVRNFMSLHVLRCKHITYCSFIIFMCECIDKRLAHCAGVKERWQGIRPWAAHLFIIHLASVYIYFMLCLSTYFRLSSSLCSTCISHPLASSSYITLKYTHKFFGLQIIWDEYNTKILPTPRNLRFGMWNLYCTFLHFKWVGWAGLGTRDVCRRCCSVNLFKEVCDAHAHAHAMHYHSYMFSQYALHVFLRTTNFQYIYLMFIDRVIYSFYCFICFVCMMDVC